MSLDGVAVSKTDFLNSLKFEIYFYVNKVSRITPVVLIFHLVKTVQCSIQPQADV